MNIIFLDIDGVVATPLSVVAYPDNGKLWSIDPTLIKAVAQVAKLAEAKVVISSTWRYHHNFCTMHDLLCGFGVGDILYSGDAWKTPQLRGIRGNEIDAWLKAREAECVEITNYVILDDDDDFTDHQKDKHFIHTNGMIGFTFDNYLDTLEIFGLRDS